MNFATQLKQELDADGRPRGEQAKAFGIPGSNLSQFASGKETCGPKQLRRILAKVPQDVGDRLSAAWLRDQIPESVSPGRISIVVNAPALCDTAAFPEMDEELREILISLANRAMKHPDIRTALRSLESALRR